MDKDQLLQICKYVGIAIKHDNHILMEVKVTLRKLCSTRV